MKLWFLWFTTRIRGKKIKFQLISLSQEYFFLRTGDTATPRECWYINSLLAPYEILYSVKFVNWDNKISDKYCLNSFNSLCLSIIQLAHRFKQTYTSKDIDLSLVHKYALSYLCNRTKDDAMDFWSKLLRFCCGILDNGYASTRWWRHR